MARPRAASVLGVCLLVAPFCAGPPGLEIAAAALLRGAPSATRTSAPRRPWRRTRTGAGTGAGGLAVARARRGDACGRRARAGESAPRAAEGAGIGGTGQLQDLTLQIVLVGGGAVGLFFALLLLSSLRGRVHIRLYDSRWAAPPAPAGGVGRVTWAPDARRSRHIVTLDGDAWCRLSGEQQRAVFPPGGFLEQWPLREDDAAGHARNVMLSELEDRLLALVQEPELAGAVELCPRAYDAEEHRRLGDSRAVHGFVLADGADATTARDKFLRAHVGEPSHSRGTTEREVLSVTFELDEGAEALDVLECTALSLAQRRFFVNLCDSRRGVMHVLLDECDGDQAAQAPVISRGSEVRQALRQREVEDSQIQEQAQERWRAIAADGLQLFGVPTEAVTSMAKMSTRCLQFPRYHATLQDFQPPVGSEALQHPCAFLLGEAAGMVDPAPGRGIGAALRAAGSLAELLPLVWQQVASGWTVQRDQLQSFSIDAGELAASDARAHSRRFAAPRDAAAPGGGAVGPEGDAAESDEGLARGELLDRAAMLLQDLARCGPRLPLDLRAAIGAGRAPAGARLRAAPVGGQLSAGAWRRLRDLGAWGVHEFATRGQDPRDAAAARQPAAASADAVARQKALNVENAAGGGQTETSVKAAYNRGVRLVKGAGGVADDSAAYEAFLEAARGGHREARYAVGVMLLQGKGVAKDDARASYWFKKAADEGHVKAQYNLSLMLRHGLGTEPDALVAGFYQQKAASQLHVGAMRDDLECKYGDTVWMNYDPNRMGAEAIEREAEEGNAPAQYRLGMMYFNGERKTQDTAKAVEWLTRSAESGYANGHYSLFQIYLKGHGVQKDTQKSKKHLLAGAQMGEPRALYELGRRLYWPDKDLGMKRDFKKGAEMFRRSAEQGFPPGMGEYGWVCLTSKWGADGPEVGRRLLRQAAEKGDTTLRDRYQTTITRF